MTKRIFSIFTAAAVVTTFAACDGGAGDGDVVERDTTAMPVTATDTMEMPVEVTRQDTVLTETVITQDTIRGEVVDTPVTRP